MQLATYYLSKRKMGPTKEWNNKKIEKKTYYTQLLCVENVVIVVHVQIPINMLPMNCINPYFIFFFCCVSGSDDRAMYLLIVHSDIATATYDRKLIEKKSRMHLNVSTERLQNGEPSHERYDVKKCEVNELVRRTIFIIVLLPI